MSIELFKTAAKHSLQVYTKNISVGFGTEIDYRLVSINGKRWQVLSIAGTNGWLWDMLKNINILSRAGIKLSAYRAAGRIKKYLNINTTMPLLITGHSLGGAAAIAYKKRFKKGRCIVFAPANCLRRYRSRKMSDTTVFLDPDDPVTQIFGRLSFGLPDCETIRAEDNCTFYSFDSHPMKNWGKFVGDM